jgi:hypothetical protein
MSNKRTDQERFDALADALGESILQERDEEALEELRMSGINPDAEAIRVKTLILARVKAYQQRRLRAAREGYDQQIEKLEQKTYLIPKTPGERRDLFSLILRRPQYAGYVTAQFRDLESLTDNDIKSQLEDLAELGILAQLDNGKTDGQE